MLGTKRDVDDPTKSSDVNKRTCGCWETTESLISGDESDEGNFFELRPEFADELCKSVASLTLSNDHGVLFASSGIAFTRHLNVTKFLTSASLVRALKDAAALRAARKGHNALKIEVRHEGNLLLGRLEEYDLDHEIAIVSVTTPHQFCCLHLHSAMDFPLHSEVVAIGRHSSGKVVVKRGRLTVCSWASQSEDSEYLMFSTCRYSEELKGGPLFDLRHGDFFGMNLFSDVGGSIFLPTSIICERLEHFRMHPQRSVFVQLVKTVRDKEPATGDKHNSQAEAYKDIRNTIQISDYKEKIGDLASLGYPRPSLHNIDPGMILVNTFEETFGDKYPGGVWSEFRERVSSNILRNVVALASSTGGTRIFASTGLFIDFDGESTTILTSANLVRCPNGARRIVEDLRIEVLLPNKQRREGTLKHSSLYYNVALVCVKNFRAVRPASLEHEQINLSCRLVAVGRCYNSGETMAASGIITEARLTAFDCQDLRQSTCKITKAGIGGPLVDFDGNFIGMNFYGRTERTPFLLCDVLRGILQYFKTKNTMYTRLSGGLDNIIEDGNKQNCRWQVPEPQWYVPRDQEPTKLDDPSEKYERAVQASGHQYRYLSGDVHVLK